MAVGVGRSPGERWKKANRPGKLFSGKCKKKPDTQLNQNTSLEYILQLTKTIWFYSLQQKFLVKASGHQTPRSRNGNFSIKVNCHNQCTPTP